MNWYRKVRLHNCCRLLPWPQKRNAISCNIGKFNM